MSVKFGLVNLIVDTMINQPLEIDELYYVLLKGAKNAIDKRDQYGDVINNVFWPIVAARESNLLQHNSQAINGFTCSEHDNVVGH